MGRIIQGSKNEKKNSQQLGMQARSTMKSSNLPTMHFSTRRWPRVLETMENRQTVGLDH